jgi:glycerate 2-kinase
MKILVAPDKFKGSLSAREVAENIAIGLREVLPEAKIDIVPMADGGEGTADVICDALHGSWVNCRAHDPLGREIETRYAFVEDRKLAVMEMSAAAGMKLLRPDEYDVDRASTFGVGEMLLDATRHGANEIIVGLGGSATNDGGFGMARALGFRFLDERDNEIKAIAALLELQRIVRQNVEVLVPSTYPEKRRSPRRAPLQRLRVIAAADVRNPLLGENGATRVFGPQKGMKPGEIDMFEQALAKYADVVARDLYVDFRNEPGTGAAGGLGFGLMSFCGAELRSGFDVVSEAVGLESKMKDVDLVITGEGSLDRQTLEGKTPAGVSRLARKLGKRVFAIVGRANEDREARELFDGVYELGGSIAQARELLWERARELASNF